MASFSCEDPNFKGESNEESASTFIVSTCQLLPKSSSTAVSDHSRDLIASTCPENRAYSICCGSSAEFYIRPLHPCIDDIDYLLPRADELAFSGNSPVLPSDASGLADSIMCLKIESCPWYPSFAQLQYVGKMKYNWKHKMYEFNHTHFTNRYWTIDSAKRQVVFKSRSKIISRTLSTVSGPAIQFKQTDKHFTEHDVVDSVWCPQWPNDAKNWPTRPRKFGWPMIDTISKVVQNGCHVVCVQKPCLKCDENHRLWRLSFSVAEVTLIQSWTQIQQIVYHLLRFFAKRELIQKDCQKEDEVLCTYHLKTLMLWACEEMSPEWWENFSVITICFELLQKLSKWLKSRYCPNYFIPEANLFRDTLSLTMLKKTETRLNKFSSSRILCDWFVQNYILPFIRKMSAPSTTTQVIYPHFVNFMQPIFELFKARESVSMDTLFYDTLFHFNPCARIVIKAGCGSGLRSTFKRGHETRSRVMASSKRCKLFSIPTTQNVSCFRYVDILLSILHAAFGLGCGEISWDSSLFVELIAVISLKPDIIRSFYHNFPKTYKENICGCEPQFSEGYDSLYQSSDSRFHFLHGQDLMQNLTGSESRSEFELVSFMSKSCLRKALECEDSQLEGIVPAALAYLAALHFASSEYQEAMRLCLAVLSTEAFPKEHYTLNAGCLLFIDDVARIVGIYVLYQKITNKNIHLINRLLYLELRLSPRVFAYYSTVLGVSAEDLVLRHELPHTEFPMDNCLKALLKRNYILSDAPKQAIYRRADSPTAPSTIIIDKPIKERVIDLLMEYAAENVTLFHNAIRNEFGIQINTAECYRALYLYKCRKYNEVQHLCERILHKPDLHSDVNGPLSLANVLVMPPLDSFFDEDIQCLIGLYSLFCYLSRTHEGNRKKEHCIKDSKLANWQRDYMDWVNFVSRGLVCLECNWQFEYVNYLGGHFLARYLNVRCCLECNLPYRDAMKEFALQKIYRPFEHIVRVFLLQKVRTIQNNQNKLRVSSYQ